jgi:ubiquinone biosynthesis protein
VRARHLFRLAGIYRVLARHRLQQIAVRTHLLGPARFLLYLLPGVWIGRESAPLGVRVRRALEDLGPIFVKFGQALSTRPDLLPADIARELAKLQDQVPPFPGTEARAILERAYRRPLEQVFAAFAEQPLASASIAQVHAATLHDGHDVVVKVLRPRVERLIHSDVDVLKAMAALAQRYWVESRRFRPIDIVAEYEKTVLDELDLMREAANAAQLRRNFPPPSPLYVPEVHWDYCRTNVLVLERVRGVPVSDIATLHARGVNMEKLARYGVETFFTQVFEHNFFHADMHPGNIFVDTTDPGNPRYIAVDFGIVGTLTPRDQHYLAANLLAFFERDYRRVAELHVQSGWVAPQTRVDELEAAVRTVCEPIFNRPLKEISFGHFLLRMFQVARRFNMEVQPQLVLLQKTLLNIEGLGRQLYPDLDLWKTAKPFLEDWMADRLSAASIAARMRAELPALAAELPQLPQVALRAIQQLAENRVAVRMDERSLGRIERALRESAQRRQRTLAAATLLVAGLLLLGLEWLPRSVGAIVAIAGALLLVASLRR